MGFPPPSENVKSVGLVTRDAIPSFEYLLARVVIPRWGSDRRIVDPPPVRVVAVTIALLRNQ